MKTILLMILMVLGLAARASAHRLDEYLQATTISVERDHVSLRLRLTPGVSVAERIVARIDSNGDGKLSAEEQAGYAEAVRRDLSLKIDERPAALTMASFVFPPVEEMKEGMGEIVLEMRAEVAAGAGVHRLTLENPHEAGAAVCLVNALVPTDPGVEIVSQNRSYDQSTYRVDVRFSGATGATVAARAGAQGPQEVTGGVGAGVAVVETYFVHGVHHILTGYDHLLFITALVLAATTLWDLVKVVTVFTVAHSLTLTLAALNLVHLPASVAEPLIAASIVFVALQNIFWPGQARGRSRLVVAFFFGLFHGLGFAGGLLELMHQMPAGMISLAIVGFSVGVEAGHQVVMLPLFFGLKAGRQMQRDVVLRTRLSMAVQRVGSAGVSVGGIYYLVAAVAGW